MNMELRLKEIQPQAVQKPERFLGETFDKNLFEAAVRGALAKTRKNLDVFIDRYPHVSVANVYRPEENRLWTASFFPGMVFLSFELTGDQGFLKYEDRYLKSFLWRLKEGNTDTHDLGFLYTLSCVAAYRATGNGRAKETALLAADALARRYSPKGKYIQAWGKMGLKYPNVRIIIDCMMNLPLLYWASEVTGDGKYREYARNHAYTSSRTLVRTDASTYHTCLMDPDSGKAVAGKTHQGLSDESTWARGQAWAVYGFALSYRYTKESYFLDVAKKAANYFINHLPADFVPYWDFTFNDANPDIKDSSAAAIFACGLLELEKHLDGEESTFYHQAACRVVRSLYENYSAASVSGSNGLLLHGTYHRNDGADECTIWGDYFYFEALAKLLTGWESFW